MRRYIFLIIALLLILSLWGCGAQSAQSTQPPTEAVTEPVVTEPPFSPEDYTFTAGTTVQGVNIGGKTVSQAAEELTAAYGEYVLDCTINGQQFRFTANDLVMECSADALTAYARAQFEGTEDAAQPEVKYDVALLKRRLGNFLNESAVNTTLVFNEESGAYELTPSIDGSYVDLDTVLSTLDYAIQNLKPALSINVTEYVEAPTLRESDTKALTTLKNANGLLTEPITYSFVLKDDEIDHVSITPDLVRGIVSYDENLDAHINEDALAELVAQINDQYGFKDIIGTFKTTHGYLVDLPVKYRAQNMDLESFTNDIRTSLLEGNTGYRPVPYLSNLEIPEIPYNGTYVEVNLSAQHLWYYKDGECMVDTDIVTGCPNRGMETPNGVYSVLTRRNGAILKGADYETWVRYWMPFYKGYGLHDAYWRDVFGGNEYLYNGSHGCVNIPPEIAGQIFQNIKVGTAVIVYGGASSGKPIQQEIWGSDSFEVTVHADPFPLDVKAAFGHGELIYTSENSKVVEVDKDGMVTVKGTGTAEVLVLFHESRFYTSATKKITITVTDPCGDNHILGNWKQTIAPTCAEGQQTKFCENCDYKEHRTVAAIWDHSYGGWTVTVKPGCENGEEAKTCIVCGDTQTRVLAAVHDFGRWKVKVEPTCLEAGVERQICDDCDYEVTRPIPATGHDYGKWKVATPATCTEAGVERQVCNDCDHEVTRAIPATGHDYDDWEVVTKATCNTTGTEHQVCDDCGHEVTRTIPATGHKFSPDKEECENGCGTANPNFKKEP